MTLALLMARAGWPVALSARRPGPQADIRAYALNAASQALLRDLKVWQAIRPTAVSAVQDMRVFGDGPGSGLRFSAYESRVEALAHIVDSAALLAALEQALAFAPGVSHERRSSGDGTDLPSPRSPPAALEVWAEGQGHRSRAQWLMRLGLDALDDDERTPYGHSALAARLSSGGAGHGSTAWQWFGGFERGGEVLALLPLSVPDEPQATWALVWSVPDARAQELLTMDDGAFVAQLAATVGERRSALPEGWSRLALASPRQIWPLTQSRLRRWAGPGWAVAGDAAHTVHPLAGQGLNLGLADAACLARVLLDPREAWRSPGDPVRLARYERERLAATQTMQAGLDALWQGFASPGGLTKAARNWGLSGFNAAGPLKRWVAAQAFG